MHRFVSVVLFTDVVLHSSILNAVSVSQRIFCILI